MVWVISGLMVGFAVLAGWARWKAGRQVLGEPPLVDPNLIFYFSLIAIIVLAANLFEQITGIDIKSATGR